MEVTTTMSPRCPKCSTVFTAHPTSLPIILPSCLHHLCSSCITSSTQSQAGAVQCCQPQCQAVLTREFVQQLLPDRHLLGSLATQHKTRNHKQGEMNDDLAQFMLLSSQVGNNHHQSQPCGFLPFTRKVCKEHGKNIEFVAVEDLTTGCSFCAVFGDLKGRCVVELSRVNRELRDSGMFKMIVDKTSTTLENMLTANTPSCAASTCYEDDVNRLESHMDKCHRLLEVVEGQLTWHLRQRDEERMRKLSNLRKEMEGKMAKLEQLVEAAEWQLENMDEEKYNIIEVIKEMDKLNNEDHIVENEIDDCKLVGDVIIDETIFSSISSHISVMHQAAANPVQDKTEGQSVLEQALQEVIGRLCDKGEISSKPATAREDLAGVEDVVLLHVESPESFYVMRTRDWKVAEMMRSQLRMMWMNGGWGKVMVDDIAVHKDDDAAEYHRVKVIMVESDLAWVTFTDQGNNSQVPLASLVSMSEDLSTLPPLAHHCTLAGVCSEHDWSEEATRGVRQFCGGDVCKATVVGDTRNYMGKDISIVTISKEEDQADISLIGYLVFRALASREAGGLAGSCEPTSFRSFLYLPLDRTVKEHLVKVVHVDSPDQMYINLVGENHSYLMYMDNMMEEMQEEYSRHEADDQKVLCPYVGLVCAAQHVGDGQYHRAQVTELLQEEGMMVRVVLVDIGFCQVVQSSRLWRICDKFLVLPAMAIRVSLGGVRPVGEGWSKGANEYVKGKVINMMVRMTLQDMKLGVEDECEVIMYKETQGSSINSMIVKKGYATSLLEHAGKNDEHPVLDIDEENSLPQLQRSVMQTGSRSSCRVVSANTPDNICLRMLDEEESFYKMSTELTSYQEALRSPSSLRHWKEGDNCVVKTPVEGWVRAKVDRMREGGMVKLLLHDHGSKFVGPVESLKPLPSKFCQAGPFCWTVELPNLVPAGGARTWTGVACEKLKEILLEAGMEVDIELGMMVTETKWQAVMFVKEKEDDSGPLDPEKYKHKSVGAMLIDMGLAIPTGKYESRDDGAGTNDAELEGMNNNIVKKDSAINERKNGFCWFSAEMPSSADFAGFVSHVDWDCNLYMSSIPDNQDNLRIIGSVLESKYSGSSPCSLDLQWFQGEDCIAQFCLDKKWYRGEVLEVRDKGEILVKFVDYGSEELCKAVNMRKGLFLTEIPVQCFTVQMDIDPITLKWEEGVLNFIHKTVVEQVLQVTIIQTKDVFPLVVRLNTKAGLDIGELLVKNGYAKGRASVVS